MRNNKSMKKALVVIVLLIIFVVVLFLFGSGTGRAPENISPEATPSSSVVN